jgi:hypothetical protein
VKFRSRSQLLMNAPFEGDPKIDVAHFTFSGAALSLWEISIADFKKATASMGVYNSCFLDFRQSLSEWHIVCI